jgi:flagellar biosynthesis protein FlhB
MGSEDKQFEASQQKLKKAREEGQVIKSQDLSTAFTMLTMFMILFALAPIIFKEISSLFIQVFESIWP